MTLVCAAGGSARSGRAKAFKVMKASWNLTKGVISFSLANDQEIAVMVKMLTKQPLSSKRPIFCISGGQGWYRNPVGHCQVEVVDGSCRQYRLCPLFAKESWWASIYLGKAAGGSLSSMQSRDDCTIKERLRYKEKGGVQMCLVF